MIKNLLFTSLMIVPTLLTAQNQKWGVGSGVSESDAEFNGFITNSTTAGFYSPIMWTAVTISENGNVTPGNAYWTRNQLGYSQGANTTNNIPINSPSRANGIAIFDSDYLDNGGVFGGTGTSPVSHKGELVSPRIDLSGNTDTTLFIKFYSMYSADQINELSVSVSTDDGTSWSPAYDYRNLQADSTEGFILVPTPNWTSGVSNLSQSRFKFTFDGSYNFAIVDDITIQSPCFTAESSITETVCGSSYTSPSGKVWTTSGIYKDTITLVNFCDSIINIDLTISSSTTSSFTETACDSYTSPSGKIWITSGIFNDTIPNANSCDSVMTIDLTINSVAVGVTQNSIDLTADMTGATYQWLDCNNNYSQIVGATNQTFTAVVNGDYAVSVSQNNCTDTSLCKTIASVNVWESEIESGLVLYPNPSNGNFSIELDQNYSNVTIEINDLQGKLIHTYNYVESQFLNISLNDQAGVYLMVVHYGDKKSIIKLIKE